MAEAESTVPVQEAAAGGTDDAVVNAEAAGPAWRGKLFRVLNWMLAWHPFIFMGMAAALALYAWIVYPEEESVQPPSPETFYYEGLDHLYRLMNPDLPLRLHDPADEALAARNSFLNLFVFHRSSLGDHPGIVNPHLLLGESNRLLAENNPELVEHAREDAAAAYADALLWEKAERAPAAAAAYAAANFFDRRSGAAEAAEAAPENFLSDNAVEIQLRQERRKEYLNFRLAESDIAMRRPDAARSILEDIQREVDARRREAFRRSLGNDAGAGDLPRRIFELGPDEYRQADLLLARAYDGTGRTDRAKFWYLRHRAGMPDERDLPLVDGRLAAMYAEEGDVYRRANPGLALAAFSAAAKHYESLIESPAAAPEQRLDAVLGLADANSHLADLTPAGEYTGTDRLIRAGETIRGWLEEFSGQPLPARTLAVPLATGKALARPEFILPLPESVGAAAAGSLVALAGGGDTLQERRRGYLAKAIANYDLAASQLPPGEKRDRAAVQAARESWRLGRKRQTEERLEKLLNPLSSQELILAARLGLAASALDRGDLRKAGMLVLGGYAHPQPLRFDAQDADWRALAMKLGNPAGRIGPGAWRALWNAISPEGRNLALYVASGRRLDGVATDRFIGAMNGVLRRDDFYQADDFPSRDWNENLARLLARPPELLFEDETVWKNRLLLEEALPYDLRRRGAFGAISFAPFPSAAELSPGGLVDPDEVRDFLVSLAEEWAAVPLGAPPAEAARRLEGSAAAYRDALERFGGNPGEINHALALNRERLAAVREIQGRNREALSLTAEAARRHLESAIRARGSLGEMQSYLDAADGFFRSGLLERAAESLERFMERFGHSSIPGTEPTMAVIRADNLLGRTYWFLHDSDRALEAFRRNVPRRTPERFNAIYYIGRVLLDAGIARDAPELLGDDAQPLPPLDRENDPQIQTALQAFNYVRQAVGINPAARAWRWSSFDLARLRHVLAERARQADSAPAGESGQRPWLDLYDRARENLTEVLERYVLDAGTKGGLSIQVEPADFADVMAARFEAEYLLAKTLLVLAEGRGSEEPAGLARAHFENLRDGRRYAAALFDPSLDRFHLNAAVIREMLGGNGAPLERSRLGDTEGPPHSPERFRAMLQNALLLLANEYFRAGERILARNGAEAGDAEGLYRRSYAVWQDVRDRFGEPLGAQALVGMGDALSRLGRPDDAANHYRMARNAAAMVSPAEAGGVDPDPGFWGGVAESRLQDMAGGFRVP
jgi:hypothetical protein